MNKSDALRKSMLDNGYAEISDSGTIMFKTYLIAEAKICARKNRSRVAQLRDSKVVEVIHDYREQV